MTPDITPELVLTAYARGAFPMADPDSGEISLFACDPRCILPLEVGGLHLSRTLKRVAKSGRFRIAFDSAFDAVVGECAGERSKENRSWISDELRALYVELHRRGHAHSVEAWLGDALVGGLYGVALAGAFFGESMFSRPQLGGTDASKVCLMALVARLRSRGFTLLDCQYSNPHMHSLGAVEIPVEEYLARLERALALTDARF